LHHVALWSTDIAADVAKLRAAGVPLEDREPRDGFTGRLSYLHASACEGVQLEVVEPEAALAGDNRSLGQITRIDHVVLRVPGVTAVSDRFAEWFGVPTKRTMERGEQAFAFMRPGDVVIEVIGPESGGEAGSGRIAGLAFEVRDIDALTEHVRAKGYPIGEPHPALQGGRIVSVHHSGACGVPVAFIDFTRNPEPTRR
jgi:catechol 2,3-dioxygenase-like lactoylglutathione lyase family enzyme